MGKETASEILVRGGAALGLVAGLMWALDQPTQTVKCPDLEGTQAGAEVGQCMADGLMASLKPYLIGGVTGLVGGAVAVLALVVLVRLAVASFRPSPIRPAVAAAEPATRWIVARFDGRCRRCGSTIRPGDRIRHRPGHTTCASCP